MQEHCSLFWQTASMGTRAQAREQMTAEILAEARRQVVELGGTGLSMRAVARGVGLVSSAVYRYFPTRDALLTTMVVESYKKLAATLAGVGGVADDASADTEAAAERWRALAGAFRAWAREFPHEFHLVYGTPIAGYQAPPETIPAATAVATHFLAVGARRPVAEFDSEELREQLAGLATTMGEPRLDPAGSAAVLAELAALVGFVGLELGGHFVGTADPADALFDALVGRQVATLGLT